MFVCNFHKNEYCGVPSRGIWWEWSSQIAKEEEYLVYRHITIQAYIVQCNSSSCGRKKCCWASLDQRENWDSFWQYEEEMCFWHVRCNQLWMSPTNGFFDLVWICKLRNIFWVSPTNNERGLKQLGCPFLVREHSGEWNLSMIKVTFLLRGVKLTHKWDIIFENEACNSFGGIRYDLCSST